jgi:Tfp pilus assembly protein PilV
MRKGLLLLGVLGVAALGVAAVAVARAASGPQGEALRRQAMIAAFRARQAAARATEAGEATLAKARAFVSGRPAEPAPDAAPSDAI